MIFTWAPKISSELCRLRSAHSDMLAYMYMYKQSVLQHIIKMLINIDMYMLQVNLLN